MGNKRKGTDVLTSPVVVSGINTSWDGTIQRMRDMSMNESLYGNVMNGIEKTSELMSSLEAKRKEVDVEAEHIKNSLLNEIELAREACREESDDLYRMKVQLQQLEAERDAIQEGLVDLETQSVQAKDRIRAYQAEAQQELESFSRVEAERIKEVPRLKNQISLYASTTGIKWDFDQQDLLAGEVDIPNLNIVRRFSIDPKERSDFDVAADLWSLMDGNPSPHTTTST